MRVAPFKDKVLVRKIVCSASDHYGKAELIDIPEYARRELKFCGEVLGVGPHVREDLRRGDIVLLDAYGEYSWETDSVADGELAIIGERDVLAQLSERPNYLSVVPEDARELDEVA